MKPRVITKCVANAHAAANERIVEFSSSRGGGLIAFTEYEDKLVVDIYRCDKTVEVRVGKPEA